MKMNAKSATMMDVQISGKIIDHNRPGKLLTPPKRAEITYQIFDMLESLGFNAV